MVWVREEVERIGYSFQRFMVMLGGHPLRHLSLIYQVFLYQVFPAVSKFRVTNQVTIVDLQMLRLVRRVVIVPNDDRPEPTRSRQSGCIECVTQTSHKT